MAAVVSRHELNKVVRQKMLCEKIVFIDGQPGCGKTMLSPIISAFDRVELLNYAFEVEFICRLFYFGKIDGDAATAMVRMLVDHKLYQTMMGRETNFRYSDLSSVFKNPHPWRYIKRIFQEGDLIVPDRIKNDRPILSLTTHDLLSVSDPIISGIGPQSVIIEMVRHPLYMVKQQYLNMSRLIDDPRDIQICLEYHGKQLPFFASGWEDLFVKSNDMEKAIYTIDKLTNTNKIKRNIWKENKQLSLVTIPFEKFVLDPWPYMEKIESALGSKITKTTRRVMKKQNVPRKLLTNSPALSIYKRCGWTPPSKATEEEELNSRRDFVSENASSDALAVMDRLSSQYVAEYLAN